MYNGDAVELLFLTTKLCVSFQPLQVAQSLYVLLLLIVVTVQLW